MSEILNNPITVGTTGDDELSGGNANDIIHGEAGDDTLSGGAGDDTLIGGVGADQLVGGAGSDVLYGGPGAGVDVLIWDSRLEGAGDVDRMFMSDGDQLVLNFAFADYTQNVAAEIAAFADAVAAGADPGDGGEFAFQTFGLRISGAPGSIQLFVDDQPVDPGDPPGGLAIDDDFSVDDNAAIAGDVTLNDGFDAATQSIGLVDGPGLGSLTLQVDGTFTFNTFGDFDGLSVGETAQETFTYGIFAGQTLLSTATATITIDGANEDPTGDAVTRTTDEDTAISFDVIALSGADDVDLSDELTLFSVNGVELNGGQITTDSDQLGVVTANADGTVTYDPAGAFEDLAQGAEGEDEFTFTVTDGQGGFFTETVTIDITGVNDSPVAVDETATTDQNTAIQIDVGLNDGDIDDGAVLTFSIPESAGIFGFADAVVAYNGAGNPENATGAGDNVFVSLPTGDSITLAFLDEIITDGAGDDLFIGEFGPGGEFADIEVSSDGANFSFIGTAANNTVTSFDLADINFTDQLRFVRVTGLDAGGSSPGFDLDFVQAIGVAVDGLRGDITDLGGGVLSYDPGGDFDFLGTGESLTETFSYVVTDEFGATDIGEVSVTVNGANDDPLVGQVSVDTDEDTAISFNLLALGDATDPDLPDLANLSVFSINGVELNGAPLNETSDGGAALSVSANGDVIYDPNGVFDFLADGAPFGDGFTFTITDGNGGFASQSVTVDLTGVNDAPIFEDEISVNVAQRDEPVEIDLLENASDPDGDDLFVTGVTQIQGPDVFASLGFGVYRFEGSFAEAAGGLVGGVGDINGDGVDDYAIRADASAGVAGISVVFAGGDAPLFALDLADGVADGVINLDLVSSNGAVIGTVDGVIASDIGNVTGGGEDDLLFSDPDAGVGGEVYVIPGGANLAGFGGQFDAASIDGTNGFIIVGSNAGDSLGVMDAQALGDVTGDGVGDFLIGARGFDVQTLSNAGAGYIVSGADLPLAADATGVIDVNSLLGFSSYRLDGDFSVDVPFPGVGQLGATVAAGDVDGDGVSDIFFGAPGAGGQNDQAGNGEAYLVFGGAANLEAADNADETNDNTFDVDALDGVTGFQFLGQQAFGNQFAGAEITVTGDVNGDGFNDFAISAPEPKYSRGGDTFLVYGGRDNLTAFDAYDGSSDGQINLGIVGKGFGFIISGDQNGGQSGYSVDAAGDVNGDGYSDIIIGNLGTDDINSTTPPAGRAYLLFGGDLTALDAADGGDGPNGQIIISNVTQATGLVFEQEAANDAFGSSISVRDFDGDGKVDVLIGAPQADVPDPDPQNIGLLTDAGAAYLFRGGIDGFSQLDALDGDIDGRINTADVVGTLIDFSDPPQGAFAQNGDLAIFDPSLFRSLGLNETETVVFEIEVSDGIETATNTLTITVEGENDDPTGAAVDLSTDEDTALELNLLDESNAADVDANDVLIITEVDGVALTGGAGTVTFNSGATATISEDGTLSFDPSGFYDDLAQGGADASEAFSFTVSDQNGGSFTQTATIQILGLNDAPDATDFSITAGEDDTVFGNFISESFGDAFDIDGDDIFVKTVNGDGFNEGFGGTTLDSGARVTFSFNGDFTYDPRGAFDFLSEGEDGSDSFTYTIEDEFGATVTRTVSVTVEGAPDAAVFGATEATQISLVSVTADGTASGDFSSITPQLSADGALVAFTSNATNLVTPDANGSVGDILLADVDAGTLEQINLIDGTNNQGVDATSTFIGVVDGSVADRFVAFHSGGEDLNANDTNNRIDVFVRDRDTGETELISRNLGGTSANQNSLNASVSADGRFVVFQSTATDLVEIDGNGTTADVFLHDRDAGTTILISNPGGGASRSSFNPRISADGSTVVFSSGNALVAADNNGTNDIYAYDVGTGVIELISKDSAGVVGNGSSQDVSVSDNGRYVYFTSQATNLDDAADNNGARDGFVHDRVAGTTERVSVSTFGTEANLGIEAGINAGQISGDGRFVIFTSESSNLDVITPDTNGDKDVFLHDLITGETIRLSVTLDPAGGEPGGFMPTISATGERIAFSSLDTPDAFDPRADGGNEDVYVVDVAINGAALETADGASTVDLLAKLTDPEGDDLDIANVSVTTDSGRTVVFTTDDEAGTLSFDAAQFNDLAAGDFELLTITYDVVDDTGETVSAIAGVSVERSPAGVIAADDDFTVLEDQLLTDSVATNDTPSTGAVFTLLSGPGAGELTFNSDGSFTYDQQFSFDDLDGDSETTEQFTYQIELNGETSQATADIRIFGQNDAPGAVLPFLDTVDLITVSQVGVGANADALRPTIGTDDSGQSHLFFHSDATDLDTTDDNAFTDVFFSAAPGSGTVILTSTTQAGEASDGASSFAAATSDIGVVAFESTATDLGPTDTNGVSDIYVLDSNFGGVDRVSVSTGGVEANGGSFRPVISSNGRFVAFETDATNLSASDTNGVRDVYLHDRTTFETTYVSFDSDANFTGESRIVDISADGSKILFRTANAFDGDDTNGVDDIYAYDVVEGFTTLVSQGANGEIGDGAVGVGDAEAAAAISANGRYVVFSSTAGNLVFGDNNGVEDVFVRDLQEGTTDRVSVTLNNAEGDGASFGVDISDDGRFVTFTSAATNLDEIAPDTNGLNDVFIHDRVTKDLVRASITPDFEGQPGGEQAVVSADGSLIAFVSADIGAAFDSTDNGSTRDIYLATFDHTGFTMTDGGGTSFFDLSRDFFDPEGDELFVDNLDIVSDDGRVVNFIQEDDGDGNLLPGVEIDEAQFEDLGVNDYAILTATFDISDGSSGQIGGPPPVAGTVAIVVRGLNDDPAFDDPAPSFDVNAGATFAGSVTVDDVDGDELSFFAFTSAIPATFDIDASGAFTVDVDPAAVGFFTVDLTVDDGNGGTDFATLTFNINEAPTFLGLPGAQVALINQTNGIDVSGGFVNPQNDGLNFSAGLAGGGALPGALSIDPATGVISGSPGGGATGFYRIAITATDDLGASVTGETWLAIVDETITGGPTGDALNAATVPSLGATTSQFIDGAGGNDFINAGADVDIYVFRSGDGFDQYEDNSGGAFDAVFMEGINSTDVTFSFNAGDPDDVIVELNADAGQFTNGFLWVDALIAGSSGRLDEVFFEDGTSITRQQIIDSLLGQAVANGQTTIQGLATDDTLQGTDGATLIGGQGDDLYIFNAGDGAVSIFDNASGATIDTVRFGFALEDLDSEIIPTASRVPSSDTLVLDFGGGDILTIFGTLDDRSANSIGSFEFLDQTVDNAFFRQLIVDQQATDGDDDIFGFSPELSDTLEGGLGDDFLSGGNGSDTYIYNAGDGDDVIKDIGGGDTDVLIINGFDVTLDGDGFIDPATSGISFSRATDNGADLIITLDNGGGSTSEIRIISMLDAGEISVSSGQIETVRIVGASTVEFTPEQIQAQLIFQAQTDGIAVGPGPGLGGASVAGEPGDDVVFGFDSRADTIEGGGGDDFLDGREQSDTYIYRAGDGDDTISDSGLQDTDMLRVEGFDLIVDGNNIIQPTSEVQLQALPGSGGDLLILLDNGNETGSIRLDGQLNFQLGFVIEAFEFVGSTTETLNFADLRADLIAQLSTSGDDVVDATFDSSTGQVDVIATGTGDDFASGQRGDDTYIYVAGDGRLRIHDRGLDNGDILDISGYDFADLTFSRVPGSSFGAPVEDLIRIAPTLPSATNDEILLRASWDTTNSSGIERIIDGSGAEISLTDLRQTIIDQEVAAGRPFVTGSNQADVFNTSVGDGITVAGGTRNDTYFFEVGDDFDEVIEFAFSGTDTITLNGFNSANIGTSIFLHTNSVRPDDVRIEFGGGDTLLIRNTDEIETIFFDDASFNDTQFNNLIASGVGVVAATEIDADGFFDGASTAADEVFLGGENGDDPGTPTVEDVSDRISFTAGQIGHDIITQATFGSTDVTINVGATHEVSFRLAEVDDSDLIISVIPVGATDRSDAETITVIDWRQSFTVLETVTIVTDAGPQPTLDLDAISQLIVDASATAGDDFIRGFNRASGEDGRGNELIDGGAGDDVLNGRSGTTTADAQDPTELTQDVYSFTVGANGVGGDGRDIIVDGGFGDGDRIELVSGGTTNGVGSADLANAVIRRDPFDDDDIVIDFGNDEVRIANLTGLGINDRYQEIVFDFGGLNPQTLTDEDLLALYVARQTTAGDDRVQGTALPDIIEGGPGADLLQGFRGGAGGQALNDAPGERNYDLYRYRVGENGAGGDGEDVIFDGSFSDLDVIELISNGTTNMAGSAAFENVTLRRDGSDGNDLVLDFGEDQVTIEDILDLGISARYQRIRFDAGGDDERDFTDVELIDAFFASVITDGDDVIIGTNDANIINAGLGDDFLNLGGGDDVYEITPGQGDDTVSDGVGVPSDDTVRVNANFADVSLKRDLNTGDDLIMTFAAGGSLRVAGAFANGSVFEIESFEFNDVTFDYADILSLTIASELATGRDIIHGSEDDNVDITIDTTGDGVDDTTAGALRGTARDEHLIGRGGADAYVYEVGAGGNDVIEDAATSADDTIIINGALASDLIFGRPAGAEDDLLITFRTATGSIRAVDAINTTNFGNIESIVINGDDGGTPVTTVLDLTAIRQRILSDAVTPGDDFIEGISTNVNDVFTNVNADPASAGGTDSFFGLRGNDTYIFVEDPTVVQRMFIEDNGNNSDFNTLQVTGFAAEDVAVRRLAAGSTDLILTFSGSSDQIFLKGGGDVGNTGDAIDSFVFNGEAFTQAQVLAAADGSGSLPFEGPPLIGGPMTTPFTDVPEPEPETEAAEVPAAPADPAPQPVFGTAASELFSMSSTDDTVQAGGGADTVRAGAGEDNVRGGAGADRIAGGLDEDTLRGGSGADTVIGGQGADKILGGVGADALFGQKGADEILGGGGRDKIVGGSGADEMTGGGGADRFVFKKGHGRDEITDFRVNVDVLDYSKHGGVSGFGDLDIVMRDGDAVIRDGFGGVVRLDGVRVGQLDADDFIF